jgi:hypothetical protein
MKNEERFNWKSSMPVCARAGRSVLAVFWLMLLGGCRRAPSIGIYGSYFPGWLVCLAIAVVLTLMARLLLRRYGYEDHLRPLGLVYLCLAITLTCLLWLVFFF